MDDEEELKIAIPARLSEIHNYIDALKALGAEPVQVEPDCDAREYDGLFLPGGKDISPERYGQDNTACHELDPELDAWQFAVTDAFVRLKKPIFGVCRGHQLLNVYFGGTLFQNIESAKRHVRGPDEKTDRVHSNFCETASFLSELYGTEFSTNSSHHQAVDRLGEKLHAVMYSDDGYVEAMVHRELPVWSVQWHPERMCFAFKSSRYVDGSVILRWFLEQCAKLKRQ